MDPFDRILGQSDAIERAREFGRRAAAVDASVLLTGESGTGKGLLARAIHEASTRARGPLVAVNCAGVPESLFESEFFGHSRGAFTGAQQSHRGLFEQADRGTLFLDEVGELASALQAKLLCALEDGEVRRLGAERAVRVDARLIAATGVDLERAVAEGAFRRDLYHRLFVLVFRLPALRERTGDLEFLAHHYLDGFVARYRRPIVGFGASALARMRDHAWPGNVRELAHAVEAAVLSCDGGRIEAGHLPPTLGSAGSTGAAHAGPMHTATAARPRRYVFSGTPEEERHRIEEAMHRASGNRTRAAAALGMSRLTLRKRLRSLGLDAADQ